MRWRWNPEERGGQVIYTTVTMVWTRAGRLWLQGTSQPSICAESASARARSGVRTATELLDVRKREDEASWAGDQRRLPRTGLVRAGGHWAGRGAWRQRLGTREGWENRSRSRGRIQCGGWAKVCRWHGGCWHCGRQSGRASSRMLGEAVWGGGAAAMKRWRGGGITGACRGKIKIQTGAGHQGSQGEMPLSPIVSGT